MPYIITTVTPSGWRSPDVFDGVTRTARIAVATLNEAREAAWSECERLAADAPASQATLAQCEDVPESGGTIGPLPDDTVIAVEQVNWIKLAEMAGYTGSLEGRWWPLIITTFNAKEHS